MVVVDMFIEIPANKQSLAQRKLVLGHGINDADYFTTQKIDGDDRKCPYYQAWINILKRSYSDIYRKIHPTYDSVTICGEWLRFSTFKQWMEKQDWKGKQLDKDILVPGNKHYSPYTCVFVTNDVNTVIITREHDRGPYSIGVHKHQGKYKARLNIKGSRINLGAFKTPEEAAQAYNKAKSDHILSIAAEQTDERIANGLRLHAQLYLEGKVK